MNVIEGVAGAAPSRVCPFLVYFIPALERRDRFLAIARTRRLRICSMKVEGDWQDAGLGNQGISIV